MPCARICMLLILLATLARAVEPVHYQLSFGRPNTHLMNVTIRASGLDGNTVDLAMPDWSPGAYSIRNYAAQVQAFHSSDANGRALAWHKTDSQTWQVDLKGGRTVTAR